VHKITEHPALRLRSPKVGVLKVKVTAHPQLRGLRVRIYRHAHHHDHLIGTTHTNKRGVARFTHRERPASVVHIRVKLPASAITSPAKSGTRKVTIKGA
jgi:hypothetical protein